VLSWITGHYDLSHPINTVTQTALSSYIVSMAVRAKN